MTHYLLDTNILIDLAGEKKSSPFFNQLIEGDRFQLSTSLLCLAEFAAGAGKREELFIKNWIESGELEILYLDSPEIAFAAGCLRKRNSLKLPDALILATALQWRAHLLTQDQAFLQRARTFISVTNPIQFG